jgi:hypothetical protein
MECSIFVLMNAQETTAAKIDEAAQLQARQLAHLEELREMAMEVARGLRDRIVTPAEDANPAAARLAAAFSDVATTVRRIMALEQEVAGLREQRRTGLRATLLSDRKDAVKRGVQAAVRSAVLHEEPEIERHELRERLEDLIDYEDYNDYDDADYWRGTVGDVVARICLALGVETDPTLWDETGRSLNDNLRPVAVPPDSDILDPAFADRANGAARAGDANPANGSERKSRRSRPAANGHGPPGG